MKNINKKSIAWSGGVLAVLAFALFLAPNLASAGETGNNYVFCGGCNSYVTPVYNYPTPAQNYQPAPVVQTVYYPKPVVVASTRTVPTYTQANTTAYNYDANYYANQASTSDTSGNDYSGLAANAIYGENSFLPTGILQWIMIAILILLVVLLVRRVFGRANKYHSTPLKHA